MTQAEGAQIRVLQIIVTAFLLGAGSFLAVVAFLVATGNEVSDPAGLGRILLGVWAALVVGGLAVWPFVRNRQALLAVAAIGKELGEEGRFKAAQHYATATMVGASLAEGTTLLAAVGALVTHHSGLLLCGAVGLIGIVLLFPSQQKFQRFLERGGGRFNPTAPA